MKDFNAASAILDHTEAPDNKAVAEGGDAVAGLFNGFWLSVATWVIIAGGVWLIV